MKDPTGYEVDAQAVSRAQVVAMQVLLSPAFVLASRRLVLRIAVVAVTHTLLVGALPPSCATADPLFGSPVSVGAGSYPYSVAIGDLNGDGKPDLVTANSTPSTVSVLLNIGPGPLAVEGSRMGFALQLTVPNPARELRADFSLADARPARLAIYDASGREVFRREVGNLGAGRHVIVATPGRLAPGVYFVDLTQGDRRLAARAVVIR